jgi:hypothetical protein
MASASDGGIAEEYEGDAIADDEPADVVDPPQALSTPASTTK